MRTNEIKRLQHAFVIFFVMMATSFLILFCEKPVTAEEQIPECKNEHTPNTIPEANWEYADDTEAADNVETCHFWGNSFSLKFHLKSCPFAQAMNPRHVQFLKNIQEALALGEKPCRYCLPPYTLSVSCKILDLPVSLNQSDNSVEKKPVSNAN